MPCMRSIPRLIAPSVTCLFSGSAGGNGKLSSIHRALVRLRGSHLVIDTVPVSVLMGLETLSGS